MSKILSIHSFRGGTGKSNITANLATLMARSGYRVAVVDTDIQSPGIHVPFGLDEGKICYTLNDYLWGRCPIEAAACDVSGVLKGRSPNSKGSLHLVPSSIKMNEISRILREGYDARLLNDGFQRLKEKLQLDYLLIDTHPGINEETLMSVILSDILVVILRPDQQDYQGTAVTLDVARKLEVPKMMLVLNKVLPALVTDALRQQIESAYHTPVAGILPVCEAMFELASRDIFCLQHPEHPWAKGVEAIAQQIAPPPQKFGLFKRTAPATPAPLHKPFFARSIGR
ncbi:MAG: MinD/ParA family protein [Oculatellaceae cyanobacterium Prado106]|jgi:MinD-like ATPase involved in chromosome partitioning or flagellar assembly|nr:MinD/ParA family protein [Oculatellaceae cyanobacterium Prado106]